MHDNRTERWAELPAATGGNGELTYKIVSRGYQPGDPLQEFVLPAGINITLHNGVRYLEGQPERGAGDYLLKYVAVDEDGDMDSIDFTIHVNRVPQFMHTGYTGTFLINVESRLKLPEATGGDGNLRYWITHEDLGNHLGFDAAKRELLGNVPDAGTTQLTYHAADEDNDTDAATITLTVENRLEAPAGLDLRPAADRATGNLSRTALLTWQPSRNANPDTVYDVYLAPPFEERYIHPAPLPLTGVTAGETNRLIDLERLEQYGEKTGLITFDYLEAWVVARDSTRSMLRSERSKSIRITPADITKADGKSSEQEGGSARITWKLDSQATSYTLRWRALGNDRDNHPHTSYKWVLDDTALNPPGGHRGETLIEDIQQRPSCGETTESTEQEACAEITGLALDTVYAIQLVHTRTSEDGRTQKVFSGRDFYAYPSTTSAGSGERIASMPLRKFIADSSRITYWYIFCEATFPPKPEGSGEHPYLTYIKHAARQWEHATAGLVRALPDPNPGTCTDYTEYLDEVMEKLNQYITEHTASGVMPPEEKIREQARKVLNGYKKREIASTRSADLQQNEIEMVDYSEFEGSPAAYAFEELAKAISIRECPKGVENTRGCALYDLRGDSNEATVDIVLVKDNAGKALNSTLPRPENYPGGDAVWDETDVQFNNCPKGTVLYGALVHELGHALGLHAGRESKRVFSKKNLQRQFHPSPFLLQSAMSASADAKCSPHPLDVMGIYAMYQHTSRTE